VGLAYADVAYVAFVGNLEGQPARFDRLRGMAVLQLAPVHLVVDAESGIRDVSGLRGRRVGVGTPGSGTALTATLVLNAFGIDMLPGHDGFELFGLLRQGGPTPIVVLTARGQKADKLKGLRLGADDYVTKPFDLEELLARVAAVLRRSSPTADRLVLGDVTVSFQDRTATRDGRPLRLTHREFDVLRYLFERQTRVVYRDELLREVWGYPDAPTTRSVDHAIARLRKKVEADPGQPRYIHTAHGDGYTLTPDGEPAPVPIPKP